MSYGQKDQLMVEDNIVMVFIEEICLHLKSDEVFSLNLKVEYQYTRISYI